MKAARVVLVVLALAVAGAYAFVQSGLYDISATEVLRAEPAAAPAAAAAAPTKRSTRRTAKPAANPAPPAKAAADVPVASSGAKREPLPIDLIRQALEQASDDSGWAALGPVGSYLGKVSPDFDPRLHGHKKLSDLFKGHPTLFEVDERSTPGTPGKIIYVRARR